MSDPWNNGTTLNLGDDELGFIMSTPYARIRDEMRELVNLSSDEEFVFEADTLGKVAGLYQPGGGLPMFDSSTPLAASLSFTCTKNSPCYTKLKMLEECRVQALKVLPVIWHAEADTIEGMVTLISIRGFFGSQWNYFAAPRASVESGVRTAIVNAFPRTT